jgi:hypothetical protein
MFWILQYFIELSLFRALPENEVSIINCPPPYTEEHFPPQYSINYSTNNNNNNNNNNSVGNNNDSSSSSNSYNYNFHNISSDNNFLNNHHHNNNNNNIYQSLPTQLFGRSSTLYLTEESSSTQLFILNRDEDPEEDN